MVLVCPYIAGERITVDRIGAASVGIRESRVCKRVAGQVEHVAHHVRNPVALLVESGHDRTPVDDPASQTGTQSGGLKKIILTSRIGRYGQDKRHVLERFLKVDRCDHPSVLGCCAPADLRKALIGPLPQAGEEEASVALEAAASKEPMKERPSGVDWAEVLSRTFDFDVFACVRCGGRRRGLAYLTALP
jgi:hypothetical protein